MSGGFVLVVGPSGAGKDTLIGLARRALESDARFLFLRRVVTRPSSEAEAHDTLSPERFDAAAEAGAFCLYWRAHGLGYGIPAEVERAVRAGAIAVCNVSRTMVEEARRRLPRVTVAEVIAPPEVLARRIAARGRAADDDPAARLARRVGLEGAPPELVIVNDGAPEAAAEHLIMHLRTRVGHAVPRWGAPERAPSRMPFVAGCRLR